jgi:uncharacterized repeat protein (TIGR01451 family)
MGLKLAIFFNKLPKMFFATADKAGTFVLQSTKSDLKSRGMRSKAQGLNWWGTLLRISFILLLTGSVSGVQSQTFEIAFGTDREEFGVGVIPTVDHGFLEIGIGEFPEADGTQFFDRDIYVVKVDVDGTRIWEQFYDPGDSETPSDVIQLPNQDFIIIGYRTVNPGDAEQIYLLRLDPRGRVVGQKTYNNDNRWQRGEQILAMSDGGFLVTATSRETETDKSKLMVLRLNANGDEVWRRIYDSEESTFPAGAVESPTGFTIVSTEAGGMNKNIVIQAYNEIGQPVGPLKEYGTLDSREGAEAVVPSGDGNLIFAGYTENTNRALIAKANLLGDTLWYRTYRLDESLPGVNQLNDVIVEADGLITAIGTVELPGGNVDYLLVQTETDGTPRLIKNIGDDDRPFDLAFGIAPTVDRRGYVLAGYTNESLGFGNDMLLTKVDAVAGVNTNHIRGQVYYSADGCNPYTATDRLLEGWSIVAASATKTFYGTSNAAGQFDIRVDTGVYEVRLLPRNASWEACTESMTLNLPEHYDSVRVDMALVPMQDCPELEVNLSSEPIVACETVDLSVNYANQGTVPATDVLLEIELEPELTYLGSQIEPVQINGQVLSFALGELAINERQTFDLQVQVACAEVKTQQATGARARIEAANACPSGYEGADFRVDGECDTDTEEVTFRIENVGSLPNEVGQPLRYVVIEDQIIMRGGVLDPILPGGDMEVTVDVNEGRTYRLITQQPEGVPKSTQPTYAVEGCTTAEDFSTGQVAQFPEDEGEPTFDILTKEIIEPGLTLALRANPKGYQDSLITQDTELEYTVFFTNTGLDTVNRVVIRDTLSAALALETLEMGAASHPYDFELYANGVLKITFDTIQLLPGGGSGEETGRGFVTFRLSQKPNNALGTVIRNSAAVYFDYVAPRYPEVVRHVVGCSDFFVTGCLLTDNTDFEYFPGVEINTYPNPFKLSTTVEVHGAAVAGKQLEFLLYDAYGKLVRREVFRGESLQLERRNLPSALYFYEVRAAGRPVQNGRLFVQ